MDFYKIKPDGSHTKVCIKCLDKAKLKRQQNKCKHNKLHGCIICHPNSFCEHKKLKTRCIECDGGSICIHSKRRDQCKTCGPNNFCPHGAQKSQCTTCGGASVCEHKKVRSRCKECLGGSICEHLKIRVICMKCDGACKHGNYKYTCSICDPDYKIARYVRHTVWYALKNRKELSSMEYLGCDLEKLITHIENQFTAGMSWENYGEWHMDHIVPIKYGNPSFKELCERLHYKNLQPMWAIENIRKGNRYIGKFKNNNLDKR